jgi:Tol biopolymer transport system component
MGEVYRARDMRLGRDVAIKVLPQELASHSERVRRFEQEARAVAALNHPNILAIYDVGDHEGLPYLVTELLEGETLRELLLEGKVPIRRAVGIGVQIAEGLAAAHEKGIIHRDLKPANVFITKDGRTKILDFGLARLVKGEDSSSPDSTAPTEDPGTKPGALLGTIGYMSPEQVKGRPADARSDIFSLGVLLYEMLSGKKAFTGDSEAEVMTAILKDDPPPLAAEGLELPPLLERTVAHCMEKDPDQRFQSARDIAFALESVTSGSSISVALPPPGEERRKRTLRRALGGLALITVAAGLWFGGFIHGKHEYESPVSQYRRVTFRRGYPASARYTPDAQAVVYSASWETGEPDALYVQRLASPDARPLGVSGRIVGVAGAHVFYLQAGTLCQIPLEGGVPRELISGLVYADCDRTGKKVAVVRFDPSRKRENVWAQLEYPPGRVVDEARGFEWIRSPSVSPDGTQVAYVWQEGFGSGRGDIRVLDSNGKRRTLASDWIEPDCLSWSPDGREIWFVGTKSGTCSKIHALDLSGRTRLVKNLPGSIELKDIAPDGRVLLALGRGRIEMRGRMAGDRAERDYSWLDYSCNPTLSPDGRQFVFQEAGEAGGAGEPVVSAYHWRIGDAAPKRLCTGVPYAASPDWTRVLVNQGRERPDLKIVPIGPGETVSLPTGTIEWIVWARWHPDGKRVVFVGKDPASKMRLYVQDVAGGPPRPLAGGGAPLAFTPDGESVAALPDGSGPCSYYPMDGGPPRPIPFLRDSYMEHPIGFSEDGKSLFISVGSGRCSWTVDKLDLKTGKRTPLWELRPPDRAGVFERPGGSGVWGVSPDARYYLYCYDRKLEDLYEVEGLE